MTEGLDASAIADVVAGYKLAAAVHAMVDLGIPDALGNGPLTAGELSSRLGVDGLRLDRLLRLLASRGALVLDGDRYANSGLSDSLRRGSARDMFLGWQSLPAVVSAWSGTAQAVRDGRSPFAVVHGTDLHGHLAADPAERACYEAAMSSSAEGFQEIADALDLSARAIVVSVGGGSGAELVPILKRWPHLDAILTDLPDALSAAPAVLARCGVRDRVKIVAGDARQAAPSGDAYVLSTVLRCLGEEDAIAVLAACRAAALPGASMNVIEMPLPDGPPQHPGASADMTAWVAYGGSDRTAAAWAALHAAAGWRDLCCAPLAGPFALLTSTA